MQDQVSAEDVKTLRAQTGAGMMDCKKALQESGGDMEEAAKSLKVLLFHSYRSILRSCVMTCIHVVMCGVWVLKGSTSIQCKII